MNTKSKPAIRWSLLVMYLGMMALLAACGGVTPGVTPNPTEAVPLRLDNGAVEVRDEKHAWAPVGGETTFELVGKLESTDPWKVTGNTFAVRSFTRVAEVLGIDDLTVVKGIILKDATWLAMSVEPAREKVDPAVTLTGIVDSVNPWVLSGIRLNVTGETTVTGKVVPGMIVRVEILLLEDGTWEVLGITPLSTFTEIPGCATVTATVASAKGKEIQFTGWPALPLGEDVRIENEAGNQATLSASHSVLAVICPTDTQAVITKIVVLQKSEEFPASGGRVLVCHKPDNKSGHTLSISAAAIPAHLRHGDKLGPCP